MMGITILFDASGAAHAIPEVGSDVCTHSHTVCGRCIETWTIDYTFGGAWDVTVGTDGAPMVTFATGE